MPKFVHFWLALALTACAITTPAPATATPPPPLISTSTPAATATPLPTLTPTPVPPPADKYAGWAAEAYPGVSQAEMEKMLRRMQAAGANYIWIGHNNPGEVVEGKAEPGLSYAVWAAAQTERHPQHAIALSFIEAQHAMLRAARAVGLPAVLPIGYQIHMGSDWRDLHPKEMRHDAVGQWLNIFNGGVSASFYSENYRRDIRAYYAWIQAEFVTPYRDVIMMLNLADEPLGGDYSAPAEAEFQRRTGQTFANAEAEALGRFQDEMIVEYAVWSAQEWQKLAPDLPVTISFCGAQGRWSYRMPNVEALFRETPPNFQPTFDAYLHDYLPYEPMTEAEVGSLMLFTRTLGYYSQKYQRTFWLWSAGNSWGLANYGSSNPGGISDALANGYLLALAARSTGGQLRGLAVWNYNIHDQGLYGGPETEYNRDEMFTRVSGAFADWRRLMVAPAGKVSSVLLLTDTAAHTHLGATRNSVFDTPLEFDALIPFTRQDVPAVVVGALPTLDEIETVIVLDPAPETLSAEEQTALKNFAEAGGQLLASAEVLSGLWPTPAARPAAAVALPGNPFLMQAAEWAKMFPPTSGLRVSAGGQTLLFNLTPHPLPLPQPENWRAFNRAGVRELNALQLAEHEFALNP